MNLKRDAAGVVVMVVVATGIGLLYNQFRARPLPWVYLSKAERLDLAVETLGDGETTATGRTIMSLAQFKEFVAERRGIILDARPEIFYRLGHVPGAISLPREDFEQAYLRHQAMLTSDKKRAVAVYCSGESCEDSELLCEALKRLGYKNVSVYRGGWTEWTRAGMPEESSP